MTLNLVPHFAEHPVPSVSQSAVLAAGGCPSSLGSTAPLLPSYLPGHRGLLPPALPVCSWGFAAGGLTDLLTCFHFYRKAATSLSASKGRALTAAEVFQATFLGHALEAPGQCSSGVHCQPCCTSQQRAVRFALPEKLFLQ